MLLISAILFGIAAVGGIVLAILYKGNKNRPLWLAVAHGILAAIGLISLIIGVFQETTNGLILISLILFVVVALDGFILFAYRLRGNALPSPLVYIHGLVAVIAFLILLVGIQG
ncbi:hypothetical protein SAMN05444392_11369 [Seinonella peptonophila]|uniref:Uncharacterized protein n=1 Tax=Seinonella peptonophila TaxID=112248 RepID=A0A1M5AEZ1_9BACL|nr:hypothetical protein [Seinonella peptonophila]SHF28734.1 hypothetical protein SAMN05444392_11369 [Seinonella peptonophila]